MLVGEKSIYKGSELSKRIEKFLSYNIKLDNPVSDQFRSDSN